MDVAPRPRLFDAVRTVLRRRRYSFRTEKTCLFWIRDFIRFNGCIHPRELGPDEIERHLGWLATECRVSASTRNQALSALPSLHQRVLDMALPRLEGRARAKAPKHLPTVSTREELRAAFARLDAAPLLVAHSLYGAGPHLVEALRLRVKDKDSARG